MDGIDDYDTMGVVLLYRPGHVLRRVACINTKSVEFTGEIFYKRWCYTVVAVHGITYAHNDGSSLEKF